MVLVAVVVMLAGADVVSANLLTNANLNEPSNNDGWAGSGWVSWGGPGGRPEWADRAGAGRGAAAYGWAAGSSFGFFQDVPATRGVTYDFSIWVLKEANYPEEMTQIKIEWVDATGQHLGGDIVRDISGQATDSFTRFRVSGRTTNAACTHARAVVYTQWATSTNWNGLAIKFDDASMVAVPGTLLELSDTDSGSEWALPGRLMSWLAIVTE